MGPAGGVGQGLSTPVSMGTTGFVPSHGELNLHNINQLYLTKCFISLFINCCASQSAAVSNFSTPKTNTVS